MADHTVDEWVETGRLTNETAEQPKSQTEGLYASDRMSRDYGIPKISKAADYLLNSVHGSRADRELND